MSIVCKEISMTQIKYYGVDTGIPISQKHVLRVKENNGRYSAIIIGNIRYFGQMDILLAVLAKYHQPLYKATNLKCSSHRPRAVGFRLQNRKDFIYEIEEVLPTARPLCCSEALNDY